MDEKGRDGSIGAEQNKGINIRGGDVLPRDKEPAYSLREPNRMIGNKDPITGTDILDVAGHPYIVQGHLTIYFESEETKKAYIELSSVNPHSKGLDNPDEEGEAEG